MRRPVRDAIDGALAGMIAAACMTPLRVAARRSGLIRETVPESVEDALALRLLGRAPRIASELHQTADHLMHLGYGATMGALYSVLPRRPGSRLIGRGTVLGLAIWLFGSTALLPLLRAARPAWRARARENLVSVSAHLLYGMVTSLLLDDLTTQRRERPLKRWARQHLPVG